MGNDQVEIETVSYVAQYLGLLCNILSPCSHRMSATVNRFKQGQYRPDRFPHFVQEDGQLHPNMTIKDLDAEVRAMIAGELLCCTLDMHGINQSYS